MIKSKYLFVLSLTVILGGKMILLPVTLGHCFIPKARIFQVRVFATLTRRHLVKTNAWPLSTKNGDYLLSNLCKWCQFPTEWPFHCSCGETNYRLPFEPEALLRISFAGKEQLIRFLLSAFCQTTKQSTRKNIDCIVRWSQGEKFKQEIVQIFSSVTSSFSICF